MSSDADHTRPDSTSDDARRQLDAVAASLDTMSVRVGDALGLFQALADEEMDADELAVCTGTQIAYVRYWLQIQVSHGFVECTASREPRRYRLVESLKRGLFDQGRPLVSHRCAW